MKKIILPKHIFGKDTAKALEEALNEDTVKEPEQSIPQANAPNLEGFIYVPSIKIYVAKEISLHKLTWEKTHEELKKKKLFMPAPYHFREFLKYLRDSKDSEHQRIFNDVVEVRKPWRAQWLNARFESDDSGNAYIISEDILVNGKYQTQKQKLVNYLDKNKLPGISLDDWLKSNASHGLPLSNNKDGSSYYWAPINGAVAGFSAGSGWAILSCGGGPGGVDASLGVRACAEKI